MPSPTGRSLLQKSLEAIRRGQGHLEETSKTVAARKENTGFSACATPKFELLLYNSFEGFVVFFGELEVAVDRWASIRRQSNERSAFREAMMNTSSPIRILTVDDHPVLREGIAAVLGSETDMVIVA